MNDRCVVVTGANSGVGLATVVELARRGAHVVMACRSPERGEAALALARERSGSDRLEFMECDLGSLESVRAFAARVRERHPVIDVLINNAGLVSLQRSTTRDGFEAQLGVNHLGHFLLTHLLLDSLRRAPQGRVVTVSSGAYRAGSIHWEDPHLRRGYNVVKGYAQSKLANILFTLELARRLQGTSVTANCLHPGAVSTRLGENRETGFGRTVHRLLRPFFLTPERGAATSVYLATSSEVAGVSGAYFYRERPEPLPPRVRDPQLAERLWTWSEQEVGLS